MNDRETPDVARWGELREFVAKTKPPIYNLAVDTVATAMGYIEFVVMQEKQAMAHVAFIKNGKGGMMATEFLDELMERDKDAFAEMIRNLRKDCEVVVFGHEAWMSVIKDKQYDRMKNVRPRDDPNRIEGALVQVWLSGERHLAFTSKINRKPTAMAPWELMHDSAVDKTPMGGRFS
jgi:hypothetical protein